MKKQSKLSLACLFLILSACASSDKMKKIDISNDQFDSVTLGLKKEAVIHILGEPSEVRTKNLKRETSELWIYNDNSAESTQRGAVSFDAKTNTVFGVTVLPKSEDNDRQLEYLMRNKYAGIQFEKVVPQRCHQDFSPEKIYYMNVEKGITIEQNSRSSTVESFFRTTPEYVKDAMQKLKSCER